MQKLNLPVSKINIIIASVNLHCDQVNTISHTPAASCIAIYSLETRLASYPRKAILYHTSNSASSLHGSTLVHILPAVLRLQRGRHASPSTQTSAVCVFIIQPHLPPTDSTQLSMLAVIWCQNILRTFLLCM